MKQMLLKATAVLSVFLSVPLTANAVLESRLGGLAVFDSDLNVTWIANANLGLTETFGLQRNVYIKPPSESGDGGSYIDDLGHMTWGGAITWIAAMNESGYLGFSDWRLPTSDTCFQFNCTSSEMGHLFYNELGGEANLDITSTHNSSYDLFSNFSAENYWTSTPLASQFSAAWTFRFYNGYQEPWNKEYRKAVLVVHDGDVAAIPEPETYALMLAGLVVVGAAARRRKRCIRLGRQVAFAKTVTGEYP